MWPRQLSYAVRMSSSVILPSAIHRRKVFSFRRIRLALLRHIFRRTFPVPVIRVGRLIRVPTAALRRLLDADDDLENPTVTDQYDDDPTTEPTATPALRLVPRPELAHQRTQAAPRPERNGGHP